MVRQRKPRRDSERCVSVNRGVCFNLENPYDKSLDAYVELQTNFSGYVKRLIAAEMEKRNTVAVSRYAEPLVTPQRGDMDVSEAYDEVDSMPI